MTSAACWTGAPAATRASPAPTAAPPSPPRSTSTPTRGRRREGDAWCRPWRRPGCSPRPAPSSTSTPSWPAQATPVLFGSAVLELRRPHAAGRPGRPRPRARPRADVDGAPRAGRRAVRGLRLQGPGRHGRRAPRPGRLHPGLLGRLRARHGGDPRRDRQALRHQVRPAGLRPGADDHRRGLPRRRRRPGQRHRAAGRRHPVRRGAGRVPADPARSRRSTSPWCAPRTPAGTSSSAAASSSWTHEGVVQVLRSDLRGDQAPVLAAVGPMQFEVVEHRMEHEFSAPVDLERLRLLPGPAHRPRVRAALNAPARGRGAQPHRRRAARHLQRPVAAAVGRARAARRAARAPGRLGLSAPARDSLAIRPQVGPPDVTRKLALPPDRPRSLM